MDATPGTRPSSQFAAEQMEAPDTSGTKYKFALQRGVRLPARPVVLDDHREQMPIGSEIEPHMAA
jgi:hypothetical protein